MPVDWWTKQDNIVLLTKWMAENGFPSSEVAYAVEKPWKFSEEFQQAKDEL